MAATAQTAFSVGGEWDEARFNSALARLQDMHIQLRNLRNTIPRLVEPMLESHSSPEDLYTKFVHSATTAAKDMRQFSDFMEVPESKALLERTRLRGTESPEAIAPWNVTQHKGWLVRDSGALAAKNQDKAIDDSVLDTQGSDGEAKDMGLVLNTFKHKHPKTIADMDDMSKTIKVVLPPPGRIHFTIDIDIDPKGQPTFRTSCNSSSHLLNGIVRCVSTRPQPHDLRLLLEMLAAYSDVRSKPCNGCGKLFDGKPQLPVVRRIRGSRETADEGEYAWDAFHETCA